MKRDIDCIANTAVDVLIIGGGVHGALILREAAINGLTACLIDKSDFCHATSANSLKILHGGLRYLQHLDFIRMRESICSRRFFMQIAPHLVKPIKFLTPVYGYGLRGKASLRLALYMNDLISFDRNKGISDLNRIPGGRIISPEQCIDIMPGINRDQLRGAALWHEIVAVNTERMVIEIIKEACNRGAVVANYVKAEELILENDRVRGVNAVDMITGKGLVIRSNVVVNATGPWLDELWPSAKNVKRTFWAKALNIVVNRLLFNDFAVGLESHSSHRDQDALIKRGKRLYFFVPWGSFSLIGSQYELYHEHPDRLTVGKRDIENFIEELNNTYPSAGLSFKDVTFYHCGLIPINESNGETDIQFAKKTDIIDHEKTDGIRCLFSVKSVKYTTAPRAAEIVVKKILQWYGGKKYAHSIRQPVTESANIIMHDFYRMGAYQHPELLHEALKYAIHQEMAIKLSDFIFRRTGIGSAQQPPTEILNSVADHMAKEMGWDQRQKSVEIESVINCYRGLSS